MAWGYSFLMPWELKRVFADRLISSAACRDPALDLVESAGAVFRRVTPAIGRRADEGARWLIAAVELHPIHDDEFVDDRANLAWDLAACHLRLKAKRAIKVVGERLKDANEDNM